VSTARPSENWRLGTIVALWLTETTLNVVSFLGAIIGIGIVAKNGIFMLDLVDLLRADGLSLEDALVRSGRRRLRPRVDDLARRRARTNTGVRPGCAAPAMASFDTQAAFSGTNEVAWLSNVGRGVAKSAVHVRMRPAASAVRFYVRLLKFAGGAMLRSCESMRRDEKRRWAFTLPA
jgi:hypothetical protein